MKEIMMTIKLRMFSIIKKKECKYMHRHVILSSLHQNTLILLFAYFVYYKLYLAHNGGSKKKREKF